MAILSVFILIGIILIGIMLSAKVYTLKREKSIIGMEVPRGIVNGNTALLYFKSNYCRMCRAQDSLIEQIRDKVRVIEIDVYKNPELTRLMRVFATPTIIAVKNGRVINARVGVQNLNTLNSLIRELKELNKQEVEQ